MEETAFGGEGAAVRVRGGRSDGAGSGLLNATVYEVLACVYVLFGLSRIPYSDRAMNILSFEWCCKEQKELAVHLGSFNGKKGFVCAIRTADVVQISLDRSSGR